MSRTVIALLALCLAIPAFAETEYHLMDSAGLNFAAPLVNNSSNFTNQVPFGTIVYDSSKEQFMGLDGNGNWDAMTAPGGVVQTPTVQTFTSSSGTYTTPAGVKWIRVRMVGGGGGGGGSGVSSTGGTAGNGGSTTFGTSLLTASGGSGANNNGGAGGSASVTTSSTVHQVAAFVGATGGSGQELAGSGNVFPMGSVGAGTPFGGGGTTDNGTAGGNASANTGAGGGGGGGDLSATNPNIGGGGGGAGGYVEAIIASPSSTYSYTVGAGGTVGSAGSSGNAGGTGGSGYIIVEEHYQ